MKQHERAQKEAERLLYQALGADEHRANRAVLADELGVVTSTVTRQCIGDIPVQLQTAVALAEIGELELALELLSIPLKAIGYKAVPDVSLVASGRIEDSAARAGSFAGSFLSFLCQAMADGVFDAIERRELIRQAPKVIHALQKALADAEAKESRGAA